MTLSALIRKREAGKPANDNPAKVANDGLTSGRPLARLAPLALANPTSPKTATAWRWLLHYANSDSVEVRFSPEVTHAEALATCPGAIAAEPIPETPKRKPTQAEAEELRALVTLIYAGDSEADRAEALAAALADPDGALICYRAIAAEREATA